MMAPYGGLGSRKRTPVSARTPAPDVGERFSQLRAVGERMVREPFTGITTDGTIVPGLYPLRTTGISTEPLRRAALELLKALSPTQREHASFEIASDAWRQWWNIHPFLMRHGVLLEDLAERQREQLLRLAALYTGKPRHGHAELWLERVRHHLHETFFVWIGGIGQEDVFYYRVHSPVILVEFDHQPGIAFDSAEPIRQHIHTVVRTPNGNDYGMDYPRQHHARFDHVDGRHTVRA